MWGRPLFCKTDTQTTTQLLYQLDFWSLCFETISAQQKAAGLLWLMLRLIWLAQIPRAHPNNFPGCGFLSLRSRSFSEWVCNDFLGVIFQQGDGKCVWSKKVFYRTSDVLRYCEVTKMAAVEMRRLLMLLLSLTDTAAAFVPKIIPRHAIISQKLVFRSLSLGLHSAGKSTLIQNYQK